MKFAPLTAHLTGMWAVYVGGCKWWYLCIWMLTVNIYWKSLNWLNQRVRRYHWTREYDLICRPLLFAARQLSYFVVFCPAVFLQSQHFIIQAAALCALMWSIARRWSGSSCEALRVALRSFRDKSLNIELGGGTQRPAQRALKIQHRFLKSCPEAEEQFEDQCWRSPEDPNL